MTLYAMRNGVQLTTHAAANYIRGEKSYNLRRAMSQAPLLEPKTANPLPAQCPLLPHPTHAGRHAAGRVRRGRGPLALLPRLPRLHAEARLCLARLRRLLLQQALRREHHTRARNSCPRAPLAATSSSSMALPSCAVAAARCAPRLSHRRGREPLPPRPSAFRSPPSALPSALPYSTSAHTTGRRPAPLSRAPLSPRSLLDTHWRADLTEEQGLELLERCFKEVQTRFMISMPNFTIKVVDKNGVRTVERKS